MTVTETSIPGRDYGELQLFTTPLGAPQPISSAVTTTLATFGDDAIALIASSAPPSVAAGSYLYAGLLWRSQPSLATLPADLSASLRLYNADGQQVTQADGPLYDIPTRAWDPTLLYPESAALPIPADLAPGPYSLQIIVYRQDNAEALPVSATRGQTWEVGKVEVLPQASAE